MRAQLTLRGRAVVASFSACGGGKFNCSGLVGGGKRYHFSSCRIMLGRSHVARYVLKSLRLYSSAALPESVM